ncbi:MAG: SMC family ATPase, partial [Actinomycetota bacterium]
GAGKTTILDAITFALYGGLAGDGSGTDRMRSHFAAPQAEPSVQLEFSLAAVRYRITRSPEYQRPKKRGDGFTLQAAQVHLERLDDGRWDSLSSNKAEVGDQVTEFVGLNREQFTQVMLLPQGEFAKFLRCGDDERRTVLTRLFGTQLYDRITDELDRRRAAAERSRRDSEAKIAAAVSAAAEAARLDEVNRAEVLALPPDERSVRLKDIAVELAQTAETQAAALEVAVTARDAATAAEERARQQARLMTRLTKALADLDQHEQTRAGHETQAAALDRARQAEPVRPLLTALAERERAVQTARRQLLSLLPEPGDAELAGQGGPAAAALAEQADRDAAALQHLADAEAGLPVQAKALAALQDEAAQCARRVGSLDEAATALPGRIAALEAQLDAVRTVAATAAGLQVQHDAAVRRQQAAVRLAQLEPLLLSADVALRAAVDTHQQLVDAHQLLMEARLQGMAAELAAGLADGTSCPVCGSDTHPAPAQPGAGAVTADEVDAAKDRRDEAEAQRQRQQDSRDELAR